MKRLLFSIAVLTVTSSWAGAHFIWIVPVGPDGAQAKVVFSDNLEPDEGVAIDKIGATKLMVRDATGKSVALPWKKIDHAYLVQPEVKGPAVIGGMCRYGVAQRGQGKPFLLSYYPKWIRGPIADAKPWDQLALEILPKGEGRFQVVFGGKPAVGAEVVVMGPADADKQTVATDAQGECKIRSTSAGLFGVRARHIEAKGGEYEGKKYEESRHYATLVFHAVDGQPKKAAASPAKPNTSSAGATAAPAYPPLPSAVSSFGAAVADGWVYIYGGHAGKTHTYSTETVTGAFHRLNLADPTSWEKLPAGPPAQGLALVSHGGKIYRIGGMQPRNKPGDEADNHSLESCDCFDPSSGKWKALPDLPESRSSHDAAVVGDKLIVVGGWKMTGAGNKITWCDSALVMDLKRKPLLWEVVKQPFQRRAFTVAAHAGKVYVIGGLAAQGGTELTVDIFDPEKRTWSLGPDLPGAQRNGFSPAACDAGGRLFVSTADGKIIRLAAKGDAWEEVGALKHPRIVHRIVAAGPELLIALGGASKEGNVALSESICASEYRWQIGKPLNGLHRSSDAI